MPNKPLTAEQILDVLSGRRFAAWFGYKDEFNSEEERRFNSEEERSEPNRNFDSYITGEYPEGHPKHVSKDQILEDIRKMFKCK